METIEVKELKVGDLFMFMHPYDKDKEVALYEVVTVDGEQCRARCFFSTEDYAIGKTFHFFNCGLPVQLIRRKADG